MPTTLDELARLVDGKVIGDGSVAIHDAKPIDSATEGDITLLESAKYAAKLTDSPAAAVVIGKQAPPPTIPAIQVDDPLFAFATIVRHFRRITDAPLRGIHSLADIHPSAVIGEKTGIAAFVSIGEASTVGARCQLHAGVVIGRNCRIGEEVVLHPGVVLYDGCEVGNRVVIHANSVIGADGFGYRMQGGMHAKVPQLGNVVIEDDVEIGACTTIDRGTFQATRIGAGTKIDNLVQIAHNCQIGKHNLLVAQMGIAGSSSTGDYVVVAGQVGIVDHAHIGAGAVIGAKAGVTKDVPPGQCWVGQPAGPEREQKRMVMSIMKLPEMRRDLKRVKEHLGLDREESAA